MGTFIQIIRDEDMAIRACGRACADMSPLTLPVLPATAPISLAALLRAHPEAEIQQEWLEAMEADSTLH